MRQKNIGWSRVLVVDVLGALTWIHEHCGVRLYHIILHNCHAVFIDLSPSGHFDPTSLCIYVRDRGKETEQIVGFCGTFSRC